MPDEGGLNPRDEVVAGEGMAGCVQVRALGWSSHTHGREAPAGINLFWKEVRACQMGRVLA